MRKLIPQRFRCLHLLAGYLKSEVANAESEAASPPQTAALIEELAVGNLPAPCE